MFLRNAWYVFDWSHQLQDGTRPLGRIIIGEPVVVWRDDEGLLHAMEDRCPHRHAPLSLGRVDGCTLKCMYHGMTFDGEGRCVGVPLAQSPPKVSLKVYPAAEKHGWIWVWMGDPAFGDKALIPDAFGIDDPGEPMKANSIEYDAHYQLIHDNLCDLSHVDFVHATTLQPASGAHWSKTSPRIRVEERSILFERWFVDAQLPGGDGETVDTWSTYHFVVPGIFVMRGARYPVGTAARCNGEEPRGFDPIVRNIEQQAVTPICDRRTAYHYATGLVGKTAEITRDLSTRMDVIMAAFTEDQQMIEAQQRIWSLTPSNTPKHFLPQDKGPFLMRQLMQKLIEKENSSGWSGAV